jgi:hypothetical protein
MNFDNFVVLLAKWRLRYNNGSMFTNIFVQLAMLEASAKIWAETFAFYGIPPAAVYVAIPIVYVGGTGGLGYVYEYVKMWEKEMSHMNLIVNKEIREMLVQIRESWEMLKKMEGK